MYRKIIIFCICLNLYSLPSHAESTTPWFTGPLFASNGRTVPPNDFNFELYGFYTNTFGIFTEDWKSVDVPNIYTTQAVPILTYGLADRVDAQFNVPYAQNNTQGVSNRHLGDVASTLGFQLFRQGDDAWFDLRLTVQEIFPTGRFDDLNPTNQGADGTGVGSYQTGVAMNFQRLHLFGNHHYRERFVINYVYATTAKIRGASVYGGNFSTRGVIDPGNLFSVDYAGEFELTRHWVLVMEAFYFYHSHRSFKGFPGIDEDGNLLDLTLGSTAVMSLAPAIEYNISENYGIIAGIWFPIRGKNIGNFISGVIAFNYFF